MRRRSRFNLGRMLLFTLALLCLMYFCQKAYVLYELHAQIREAEETRSELLQEKAALEKRKEALQDPAVIERKARDDLGMVKPDEVPYVR